MPTWPCYLPSAVAQKAHDVGKWKNGPSPGDLTFTASDQKRSPTNTYITAKERIMNQSRTCQETRLCPGIWSLCDIGGFSESPAACYWGTEREGYILRALPPFPTRLSLWGQQGHSHGCTELVHCSTRSSGQTRTSGGEDGCVHRLQGQDHFSGVGERMCQLLAFPTPDPALPRLPAVTSSESWWYVHPEAGRSAALEKSKADGQWAPLRVPR